MSTLFLASVENLYWGNQTKDRPRYLINDRAFTQSHKVKIDWTDNYTGLVKLRGVNFNYARYKTNYYFLELQKPFGGDWYLYRIVYDFWCNEVLKKAVTIKGTLSKTSDTDLVLKYIDYTLPLIENGNTIDYLNLEHDSGGHVPTFNFLASSLKPWDRYLDPAALMQFFIKILLKKSEEVERTGLDQSRLIIPALQFATYKWRWYIPLLRDVVNHLNEHKKTLAVYEIDVEATTTLLASIKGMQRGHEGKFLQIGGQENLFLGNKRLETKKIIGVDFSGLTDVRLLNPETLKPMDAPKRKLKDTPQASIVADKLTRNDLEDFTIVPRVETQVVLKQDGERIELTNFKFGEIKDYAQLTINGEVKKDGQLEVLTGLKDIENINWVVDSTQANFLEKHGIYTPIAVKKGDIIIPLDKYDLIHEKNRDNLSARPPRLHDPDFMDLYRPQTFDLEQTQEEPEEYRKLLIGDAWFEREALAYRPTYIRKGYTVGFMNVEKVPLQGGAKLLNRNYVYYARINQLKRKSATTTVYTPNPKVDKSYTEQEFKEKYKYNSMSDRITRASGWKSDPLTAWEWFFNDDDWFDKYGSDEMDIFTEDTAAFDLKYLVEGIFFQWPNDVPKPEGSEKWQSLQTNNLNYLKFVYSGIERIIQQSEGVTWYKSRSPKWLLRRFLKDWEKGNGFYKGFTISEITDIKAVKVTILKKVYKRKVYHLVIMYNERIRTGISWYNGGWYQGANGRFALGKNFLAEICSWYAWWWPVSLYFNLKGSTPIEKLHNLLSLSSTNTTTAYITPPYPGIGSHQDISWAPFMPTWQVENRPEWGVNWLREGYGEPLLVPTTLPAEILNPLNLDIGDVATPENFPAVADEIEWWAADLLKTHEGAYFDLVGTNYILAAKKLNDDSLTYRLILKQPTLTLVDYEIRNFQLNSPINVTSPAQVVNQFNTLYFYGEVLPLKFRKLFINQSTDTFKKFEVTPLNIEGANTAYEYRWVNLQTTADDIKRVFTCMKLTKDIQGTYDPVEYERLKVDHENSKRLRELRTLELRNQREEFNANLKIQKWSHDWQYYGAGQASWERQRNWQWYTDLARGTLGLAGAAAGLYATKATGGLAAVMGATQAVGSLVGVADSVNRLWGEGWHGPRIQREYTRDLEARRLETKEQYGSRSYTLQWEKNIVEVQQQEINERRELLQRTSGIHIEPTTDYHTHKALIKLLKIGDIHLITNYPTDWLLTRLNEYYDKNGYDIVLPNYTLNLDDLNSATSIIQFSYIDELSIFDPIARRMIENALLNGVRLRT